MELRISKRNIKKQKLELGGIGCRIRNKGE
jgi:hypothetical protein